jgi:hypothetical protein
MVETSLAIDIVEENDNSSAEGSAEQRESITPEIESQELPVERTEVENECDIERQNVSVQQNECEIINDPQKQLQDKERKEKEKEEKKPEEIDNK